MWKKHLALLKLQLVCQHGFFLPPGFGSTFTCPWPKLSHNAKQIQVVRNKQEVISIDPPLCHSICWVILAPGRWMHNPIVNVQTQPIQKIGTLTHSLSALPPTRQLTRVFFVLLLDTGWDAQGSYWAQCPMMHLPSTTITTPSWNSWEMDCSASHNRIASTHQDTVWSKVVTWVLRALCIVSCKQASKQASKQAHGHVDAKKK